MSISIADSYKDEFLSHAPANERIDFSTSRLIQPKPGSASYRSRQVPSDGRSAGNNTGANNSKCNSHRLLMADSSGDDLTDKRPVTNQIMSRRPDLETFNTARVNNLDFEPVESER